MVLDPVKNIGKICTSLEKYYDVVARKIMVKPRPVLIIGFEDDYTDPTEVDYELLPISTLKNRKPHPVYDIPLDENTYQLLGLASPCYIRTHKTSWNHTKHLRLDKPICDLKTVRMDLFIESIEKNLSWIKSRSEFVLANYKESQIALSEDNQ